MSARIGVRAAQWVSDHAFTTSRGRVLVPDLYGIPRGVERTLTRVYGTPYTIDRGEVAYWDLGQAADGEAAS